MTAEKAMLGAFGRGEYAVNSQQGKTAGFCSVRARMFTAPQTYIHINSTHAHTHTLLILTGMMQHTDQQCILCLHNVLGN
jgi:hypothetical protein